MKIGFGEKTIVTTVYVKLVAPDQLLLSETVCQLLGIVSYHPSVGRSQLPEETVNEVNAPCTKITEIGKIDEDIPSVEESLQISTEKQQSPILPAKDTKHTVPAARVRLVSTVRLPACYLATVPVQVEEIRGSVLIEPGGLLDDCLQVNESIVEVDENGLTTLLNVNKGKLPCYLRSGMQLANANEVDSELLNITSQAPDPRMVQDHQKFPRHNYQTLLMKQWN